MRLHLEDIHADLRRGDRSGIEDAFRALVDWPDNVEARIGVPEPIAGTAPAQRGKLLRDVCEALIDGENARIMPRETFDAIVDEAEDIDGATYADGARAVLKCFAFFHARLGREA